MVLNHTSHEYIIPSVFMNCAAEEGRNSLHLRAGQVRSGHYTACEEGYNQESTFITEYAPSAGDVGLSIYPGQNQLLSFSEEEYKPPDPPVGAALGKEEQDGYDHIE